MKRMLAASAVVCLAGAIFQPAPYAQAPGGIMRTGELAAGDRTLRSGEYYDEHTFEGRAGQQVTFNLTSPSFDTFLMVVAPSGDKQENDDWQNSSRQSRLQLTLSETGTYRIIVTSYEKGERGSYELLITPTGSGLTGGSPARLESGRLVSGDRQLQSGEFFDEFTLQGRQGQTVTLDLRSRDFDPFLILTGPGNLRKENDDYEGDSRRSFLSFEMPADGAYRILVTTYKPGESGNYDLSIQQSGGGAGGSAPADTGTSRIERGRLAAGDRTLQSGEFMDTITFDGRPGQRVTLDLSSRDFDTYLILIPPRGDRQENDDVEGRTGASVIQADLTEPGTYRVLVTSYKKGETGDYELRINFDAPASTPGGTPDDRSRDVATIELGATRAGELTASDARLTDGEYRDMFAFDGTTGQTVVIELASSAFDTYLVVVPPDGEQIDNDDFEQRQDLSRLELPLRATGRYRIIVTSYDAGETGAYRLTLRAGAATATPTPPAGGAAGNAMGRTYGVFVGISDYPGDANDLMYTADDARRIRDALISSGRMREADGALLVDNRATLANVRQAFQEIAGRAGPQDVFIFFYSGHGNRIERTTRQPAEPDDLDETLVFYDDELTDDQMSQWFAGLRTRASLLVLDSCFSGGFSKDVIISPGQMGLFSSQEDVTSAVAGKFRAGGYLAHFMAEAIGDDLADTDHDRQITAIELRQYLHERFRVDVKLSARENYVRTGGPQTGYQHLVVDPGGVGPYDVLFRR